MRLGAERVTFNRKRGVIHYIVHMDGAGVCVDGVWTSIMFKPYPKDEADKGWNKMIKRWDVAV